VKERKKERKKSTRPKMNNCRKYLLLSKLEKRKKKKNYIRRKTMQRVRQCRLRLPSCRPRP
jgi:hypothetical protein